MDKSQTSDKIPQYLINKDNWICWKKKERKNKQGETQISKVPCSPGGQPVSATNPENWMSYEDAEKSRMKPTVDGIGYCFSPEDTVTGIDLDDCRDSSTGEIDDWALEVMNNISTFWEISPSGTGFHGYAHAILPGPKNKANVADAEGHIEMYEENRFFTCTGNELTQVSTGSVDRQARAVRDIYNSFFETTDSTESNSTSKKPEDHDSKYDDTYITVHDVLDQSLSEQERTAHPVHGSSTGSNFMIDEGGETWRCWRHGCTGNALHLLGMQDEIINCGEWTSGEVTNQQWGKILHAARQRGFEIGEKTIPEGICVDLKEKYGKYGTEIEDDEMYFDEVSTFKIRLNAILEDKYTDETKLDITVLPASNSFGNYDVVVSTDVFNDIQQFRTKVCTGPSTAWMGMMSDLHELRKVIVHQTAPRRTSTQKVGLHGEEMVTPNGIITNEISNPEYRYDPTGRAIDAKWNLSTDNLTYDESEVARIMELLPKTRDSERLLPLIGWYYASLFTPQIRKQEGEIAQAMVTGDTGTGKTSTLSTLQQMFGLDGTPSSASDTTFATLKNLSSTTNIPVWLDEYKPSDMSSRQLNQLQDYLRKTTRKGEETRGNPDKTVTRYILSSPVLMSGEEIVQGNAEQRRFIRTQFRAKTTNDGTNTAKAYAILTGGNWESPSGEVQVYDGCELQEHAKAVYQQVLDYRQTEIENGWDDAVETAYTVISQNGITGLSDIEITGLAMISFGCAVYRDMATDMDADDPIETEEVESAMLYIARSMGDTRESHVDEFLRLLSVSDPAQETYRMDDNDKLRVNVTKAHHSVCQYLKDHDLTDSYDILNRPRDYSRRMEDKMQSESYIIDKKNDHIVNRCYTIDIDEANNTIDGLEISNFL